MISIFDVDGTLMNINHRRHHVTGEVKNWKEFKAMTAFDQPYPHIHALAQKLSQSVTDTLFVVSGRNETEREVTEDQLRNINYRELFMRPNDNFEPDHVFKKQILDYLRENGYEPDIVVDDRPQVVQMWRDEGIPVLDVGTWE